MDYTNILERINTSSWSAQQEQVRPPYISSPSGCTQTTLTYLVSRYLYVLDSLGTVYLPLPDSRQGDPFETHRSVQLVVGRTGR
jgi:hypothetical protein